MNTRKLVNSIFSLLRHFSDLSPTVLATPEYSLSIGTKKYTFSQEKWDNILKSFSNTEKELLSGLYLEGRLDHE